WYQGALIEAYFHSTCGSRTAAVEEAFRTARGRPYLRPVSDESGHGHAYCDISPRFRWREEWDAATLRAILSRTLPAVMNARPRGSGLPYDSHHLLPGDPCRAPLLRRSGGRPDRRSV